MLVRMMESELLIRYHVINFLPAPFSPFFLTCDYIRLTFLTAIGEFLSQVYGMDPIIINQLMYGIRGTDGSFTSGYVKSFQTQERWGWSHEQLEAFEQNSFIDWATRKLGRGT